jgi:hypothetical protein
MDGEGLAQRSGPSACATEAACVGTLDRGAEVLAQVNETKSLAHELFQQPLLNRKHPNDQDHAKHG